MTDRIYEALGRIEGQLELIVPDVQDTKKRLASVEKKQYGILTVFGLAWAAFLSYFGGGSG